MDMRVEFVCFTYLSANNITVVFAETELNCTDEGASLSKL